MAVEKFDLVLDKAEKITPHALHMAFHRADGKPLIFTSGQFITFLLNDAEGQLKRRSYSISTIPTQCDNQSPLNTIERIEIALTYVENGIASESLFNMQPGEHFAAMGPVGRLIMADDSDKKRYVLVATSTGVSPYRAMLPRLAERFAERPDFKVDLLLGVQHREDLLYAQDFLDFQQQYPDHFRFHACLSREDLSSVSHPHEKSGYVQQQFANLKLNAQDDAVYLCGNPDMIDQGYAELTAMGFEVKDIRREKYISSR